MAAKNKLSPAGLDFTPTIHHDTYEYIKPEKLDLKNCAVLITGASKGIGRETALSYARAGASFIAIAARSPLDTLKDELEAASRTAGRQPPHVLPLQVDVTDLSNVEKAAKEVESAFGRLDIVINNAGYLEPFKKMLDADPAEWKRSYEVNVFGVFHVARAFMPLLLKTTDGLKQVLNLSSVGAHFTMPGGSAYQPTKLAVLRFSAFIGLEYPELLSYAIHPGGVQTELASNMGKQYEHLLIDTPQLSADSIVWLSAERRDWLQGRYVSVTWDMAELLEKRKKIEDEDLLKVRMAVA
ncbi:NAD-P-binding protein [Hortaea werneckii]|nr:NAD-P-binding protein [Hortaea werneckii]